MRIIYLKNEYTNANPFLKWAGGKAQLLETLATDYRMISLKVE